MIFVKLEDIAELKSGPFGVVFNGVDFVSSQNGIPVLEVCNLGKGTIDARNAKRIAKEDVGTFKAYCLKEGDIILGRIGATDKFAYVEKENEGWIQGTDCIRIRCYIGINARYIAHCINTDFVRQQLSNARIGGNIPSINTKALKNIRFPYPDLQVQDEIEKKLTFFTKKINVNQKYMEQSKKLLSSIFNHWFLDYQIPYDGRAGEFTTWCEKLKREIPENWELVRLEDVTKHLTDGEHGSVSEDPKGQYWMYGAGNIKDGQVVPSPSDKRIGYETYQRIHKRTGTSKGDILLTTAGTIGNIAYLQEDLDSIEFLRSVTTIRPDPNRITAEYLYQYLLAATPQIHALKKGSGQKSIALSDLRKMPILLPPLDIQQLYSEKTIPFYRMLEVARKENITLMTLYHLVIDQLLEAAAKK